jgi:hypothetical protein
MLDARRDYLMRQIQELAQCVARLLGLTAKGAWAEADRTLDEAYRTLLGLPKAMVERLDIATVLTVIQSPDKVDLAAKLLDEEAKLCTAKGDKVAAERLAKRADLLRNSLPEPRESLR